MASKSKKTKSSGRFSSRYGTKVRAKITEVESKQRKKQICPFCKGTAKRKAKGIWKCNKCSKKFASSTFYIE